MIPTPHFAPMASLEYRKLQSDGWTGGSSLSRILSESPAHVAASKDRPATPPMLFGTMTHCGQLEPEALHLRYRPAPKVYKVEVDYRKEKATSVPGAAEAGWWARDADAGDAGAYAGPFKTKAAAQKGYGPWRLDGDDDRKPYRTRADAEAAAETIDGDDRLVASEADFGRVAAMVDVVDAHPMARGLLRGGAAEVTQFWNCTTSGAQCSGQIDYWLDSARVVVDYKTHGRPMAPRQAQRWIMDRGIHVQLAHYGDGVLAATGAPPDEYYVVAQETAPPYAVGVYRLDPKLIALGEYQRQRALAIIESCRASGVWPAYPAEAVDVAAPDWSLSADFEAWRFRTMQAAAERDAVAAAAEADVARLAAVKAEVSAVALEAARLAAGRDFRGALDLWESIADLRAVIGDGDLR